MEETKYRYRIPPCPAYDIAAMESWLEDMAAKGWMLSHDGFFCGVATFEQAPPRKLRFRLDATPTNGGLFSREYAPEDDVIDLNEQMGWHYHARRGQFHIYYADDPAAPELHTDPRIQAMTIDALGKYLRKSLLETVFVIAFDFWLFFSDILLTGAVVFGTWLVALVLVLLGWGLAREILELYTITKLRRQLRAGEALSHRADYRRYGYRQMLGGIARIALRLVVLGGVLSVWAAGITEENAIPLENYTDPLPFATLEDLYPDAVVTQEDWFLESEVTAWSDFLAPENYDYSEYASIRFADGTKEDCYLTVEYHRTRWDWVASGLAREFVGQSGDNLLDHWAARILGDEQVFVTPIDLPGADYAAWYDEYRDSPCIILLRGNVVVRANVDFIGNSHPGDVQTLAEAILSHIQ